MILYVSTLRGNLVKVRSRRGATAKRVKALAQRADVWHCDTPVEDLTPLQCNVSIGNLRASGGCSRLSTLGNSLIQDRDKIPDEACFKIVWMKQVGPQASLGQLTATEADTMDQLLKGLKMDIEQKLPNGMNSPDNLIEEVLSDPHVDVTISGTVFDVSLVHAEPRIVRAKGGKGFHIFGILYQHRQTLRHATLHQYGIDVRQVDADSPIFIRELEERIGNSRRGPQPLTSAARSH